MKKVNRRTSRKSPNPSMEELRFKFTRIVSHHQQMKVAFHHLKSQIKVGLQEAEDVFESLAIPLMRLVGVKTVEMAEEGRFSTIVTNTDLNSHGSGTKAKSPCASERGDDGHKPRELEEESYTIKATMASKELLQKQRLQLTQFVQLLRKIEFQVNSSQDDILQTLADHQASIHKFFQSAIAYIAAVHRTGQNQGTFLITLKLFKATFDRMDAAFGLVERGVERLMHDLAEQMCAPMVEYVKGLKAEMTTGTCPRLVAIVEEMGRAMRDGKLQLGEARKKVRVTEERNVEALCRLKQSEEKIRRMQEYIGFFLEAKKGSMEHNVPQKVSYQKKAPHMFLGMDEDQVKDERLMWELLKMKRTFRTPESPFGPQELLGMGSNNNCLKSTRVGSTMSSRPVTRSYLRGISPKTPCLDSYLTLGSSPSAVTHQVLSRKRVTP
ncbi:uncharacterized protein LOC130796239 isoform X1 [Actinidia eriantha]|uniref:uncharacterized protein LOC130796239 isoform X1 n=1 Tax=Actinidia eriantha TaxID=165200 RepID=UPI0025831BF5|nr:uncharacterized protein LOC130796239 isoform X1 [Actinidia eriantha]